MTPGHKHLCLETVSRALINQWEDTELMEHDRKAFRDAHVVHGEADDEVIELEHDARAVAWDDSNMAMWSWNDDMAWSWHEHDDAWESWEQDDEHETDWTDAQDETSLDAWEQHEPDEIAWLGTLEEGDFEDANELLDYQEAMATIDLAKKQIQGQRRTLADARNLVRGLKAARKFFQTNQSRGRR